VFLDCLSIILISFKLIQVKEPVLLTNLDYHKMAAVIKLHATFPLSISITIRTLGVTIHMPIGAGLFIVFIIHSFIRSVSQSVSK